MRNLFSLAIILIAIFLHSTFAEEDTSSLPDAVTKAEEVYQEKRMTLHQDYLEDVLYEQQKFLKVIDRELDRLRLSDEDQEMAMTISKTEDEKVKAALLNIANEKVKASLSLTDRKTTLLNKEMIQTDMLGNLMEPQEEIKKELIEECLIGTWVADGQKTHIRFFKDGACSHGFWEKKDDNIIWINRRSHVMSYDYKEDIWTFYSIKDEEKIYTFRRVKEE